MKMNLYLISQSEKTFCAFTSAVVAAADEEDAKTINPDQDVEETEWESVWGSTWCSSPDLVTVKYLGICAEGIKRGVIMSNYDVY